MRSFKLMASVALAAALCAPASQAGDTVYALTAGATPTLVHFQSDAPSQLSVVGAIAGVDSRYTVRAIDFRPADGLLYALATDGADGQLYTIDTALGLASSVGRGFTFSGGDPGAGFSIDFNPVVDRLRVVATFSNRSYRVNPENGTLAAQDVGTSRSLHDIAYSDNRAGATSTTLYAIDLANRLVTVGGVGGTPSPNLGQLFDIGPTGAALYPGHQLGFDIAAGGTAYLGLDLVSSTSEDTEFYTLDLATGAASFVGEVPVALLDFAVSPVPEPGRLALMLAGVAAVGRVARRRRPR